MKKMCLFIITLSIFEFSQAAYIASRDFLSVGQGARANGMGEAYVAVADDSSAIFWNPAGLTQMKGDEVSADYSSRYDNLISDARINYAWRGRKGMWGLGYTGSYIKDIPVTNSLSASDLSAIQTGSFAPATTNNRNIMNHGLLFSYSRPLTPESPHYLGATVKLIYKDMLGMVRGYGTAVDLGYLWTSIGGNLRFGANMQNAASLTSYVGTIDNLGVRATATESYIPNVKTGIGYMPTWRLLNGKLLFAFDADMLTSFAVEDYRAGVEYSFGDIISLRAGKVLGRQDGSGEDYTLGMGVRLRNVSLDFSFLSNELGETTRGTISYRLGGDYYTPSRYR